MKYGENLAAPRDPDLFQGTRLLFRRIVGKRLIGTVISDDYVTSQLLQIVKPFDNSQALPILGILNSTLMAFYFRKKYNRQDKTFPEIRIYELASLPIVYPKEGNREAKSLYLNIEGFVSRMLDLQKRLPSAKASHDRTLIERQIAATDKEIDRLVYDLYGLTQDEIDIVES